jgi:hypothetical protein
MVTSLEPLRDWVKRKSPKQGEDGQFLQAVTEMRISSEDELATPTKAHLICIIDPGVPDDIRALWEGKMVPKLRQLCGNWCNDLTVELAEPNQLFLSDYQETQRLDFDAFSLAR